MDISILSYNIHKGIGWGLRRSTLDLIQQQIQELQSDIMMFQEICGTQFEYLAAEVWPHFSYGKNAIYEKGHHGNAILSKFTILESDNIDLSMHRFERRGLLHTIVDLPPPHGKLHLFCVHLGLFGNDRRRQIEAIVNHIQKHVGPDEPLILGGDFNDWGGYATTPLIKKFGLKEAFLDIHGAYANTYPSWTPMLKLDRVYFRGFHAYEAQRLLDKPWRFLSDHLAIAVRLKLIL